MGKRRSERTLTVVHRRPCRAPSDLPYLDRNYGEVLLLWDRLLGTWIPEEHPPEYGVLAAVDSGSFVDIQTSPWGALWRDVRRAPSLADRLRYVLLAPGWSHDGEVRQARVLQARVS